MKRDNNNGRKKNVTGDSGNAYKRGDGLNLNGKRPVGESGGYSDRDDSNDAGGNNDFIGGIGETRNGQRANMTANIIMLLIKFLLNRKTKTGKLLTIVVLIIGAFLVYKFASTGNLDLGNILSDVTNTAGTASNYNDSAGKLAENNGVLNKQVASNARDRYTNIVGNGKDKVTIMVYMCGTDLESKYGMASLDLKEMMAATISDNINIIVETGGTRRWKTPGISNSTNQIYKVSSGKLTLLEDNLGQKAMTDPNTLTEFIKYCKNNYPADRNMLIMWDHGGGSISGYGYDEINARGTMTLDKINSALKSGGCKFDCVGFDACLMATYETAVMLNQYSDYMLASEETEPGTGWYYTNWLNQLSKNTSTETIILGKTIIDDFVKTCYENSPRDKTTLSIVDLAELSSNVPSEFKKFATSATKLLENKKYDVVSNARSSSREFAQHAQINQIDLVHFAKNLNTPESQEFSKALLSSIKYNRTSNTMTDSYGLSIYFPYSKISTVDSAITTYDKIGLDKEYSECVKSFSNALAGGQIVSNSSQSPLDSLLGNSLGTSSGSSSDLVGTLLSQFLGNINLNSIAGLEGKNKADFIDTNKISDMKEYYKDNYFDANNLVITNKADDKVISLTDKEWDLIQKVELNAFIDDGEGYIDLGLDNPSDMFTSDGDLNMNYDKTWLAINGHVVSYYLVSEDRTEDKYKITGRVPSLLNGERVEIILVFDDENEYGVVAGAQIIYENNPDMQAKGLVKIVDGDKIDFICDYYTYDGTFKNNYYLGEQLVVNGEMKISNIKLNDNKCKISYRLTDIYHNKYWTPSLQY